MRKPVARHRADLVLDSALGIITHRGVPSYLPTYLPATTVPSHAFRTACNNQPLGTKPITVCLVFFPPRSFRIHPSTVAVAAVPQWFSDQRALPSVASVYFCVCRTVRAPVYVCANTPFCACVSARVRFRKCSFSRACSCVSVCFFFCACVCVRENPT